MAFVTRASASCAFRFDTWCPVVALREVVCIAQRLRLGHMNVQAPEPPVLVGLRLDVEPPPQVLQPDGRHCQVAPAFPSRAPALRGHYTASSLPRARPPPSRRRPLSRGNRLYGLPSSADFAAGRGGRLHVPDLASPPCPVPHPPRGHAYRRPDLHAPWRRP